MQLIQSALLGKIFVLMDNTGFIAGVFAAATFMLFLRNKKLLFNMWAAFLLTFLFSYALKLLVARERPLDIGNYSFPSAHAALAFCLFAFFKNDKNLKHWALAIAVVIAFSRIYISAHYLSDVVAGALIGYIIGSYFAGK